VDNTLYYITVGVYMCSQYIIYFIGCWCSYWSHDTSCCHNNCCLSYILCLRMGVDSDSFALPSCHCSHFKTPTQTYYGSLGRKQEEYGGRKPGLYPM